MNVSAPAGVDDLPGFADKKFRSVPIAYHYLVVYCIIHNFRILSLNVFYG